MSGADINLESVLEENDGVVPDEICLRLLQQLKEKNDSMDMLEDNDLEILSEVMDFLPFGPADPLITKGENATWLGYIAHGGVDVVIGGKVVATMPKGKLLGGMSLFFGGIRSVDCAGGKEGGIIAAIRFDELYNLVTESPEVAIRVYSAIARGELGNLQGRLGETKKGEGTEEGGKTKKKKKKKKMTATQRAKAEVLYRSKAAAAAKEKKAKKDQMEAEKLAERKRKQKAKNEKMARQKLQRQIQDLEDAVAEKDEDLSKLNQELEEAKDAVKDTEVIKDKYTQAQREIKELKRRLRAAGKGSGKNEGSDKQKKEVKVKVQDDDGLKNALAELEKLRKQLDEQSAAADELDRLRRERDALQKKANTRESWEKVRGEAASLAAEGQEVESLKAIAALSQKYESTAAMLAKAQADAHELKQAVGHLRDAKEALEAEVSLLQNMVSKEREKTTALQELLDKEREARQRSQELSEQQAARILRLATENADLTAACSGYLMSWMKETLEKDTSKENLEAEMQRLKEMMKCMRAEHVASREEMLNSANNEKEELRLLMQAKIDDEQKASAALQAKCRSELAMAKQKLADELERERQH